MTTGLWMVILPMLGCIDNSMPLEDTGRDPAGSSQGTGSDRIDTGDAELRSMAVDSDGIHDQLVEPVDFTESNNAPPSCDGDGLSIVAEMRDADGDVVIMGHPTHHYRLWVRITNTCDEPVDLRTEQSCLVSGWTVTSGGLEGSATLPCFGGPTVRQIQPRQWIEREVTPLHDLIEGTYTIEAELGSQWQDGLTSDRAGVEFTVVSRGAL